MQTSTIPISSLSIGDIVKIPSLPNISSMTILNINQCGTRVKGSEQSIEQEDKKQTFFDYNISNMTPVVKIGVDENIRNKSLDKEKKSANIVVDQKSSPEQNYQSIQSVDQKLKNESNNMTDQNNQETQNSVVETPVVSTAVNNTVKAIAQTVQVAKEVAAAKSTPNYVKPTGSFSARAFGEQNNIPYAVALAYLKTNAKEAGKQSAGRGRPTILYTFE